jgi:hypothetical protein
MTLQILFSVLLVHQSYKLLCQSLVPLIALVLICLSALARNASQQKCAQNRCTNQTDDNEISHGVRSGLTSRLRHAGPMMSDCQPRHDPGVACSRFVGSRVLCQLDNHGRRNSRMAITTLPIRDAITSSSIRTSRTRSRNGTLQYRRMNSDCACSFRTISRDEPSSE